MNSSREHENGVKKLALPVLIAFWGAVGFFGFSNSISNVIAEAVTAVGIYG